MPIDQFGPQIALCPEHDIGQAFSPDRIFSDWSYRVAGPEHLLKPWVPQQSNTLSVVLDPPLVICLRIEFVALSVLDHVVERPPWMLSQQAP
jgi:hypothetical protein